MKDVKGLFQNLLPETDARRSITVRQTRRRAVPLAVLLASLALSSALAAGPTGWGIGSCREVTAFPANLVDPGV
jgi:hypothetical protein